MDINQLTMQLKNIASLYSEILICLLAATILGWVVGMMMRRAKYRRHTRARTRKWEKRYDALEKSARADIENLEEQLQSLASETKTMQASNRALIETLKKNDATIQKARAEAIELNRQHTETHERLQRIIQHKDRDIVELGSRLNSSPKLKERQLAVHVAPAALVSMPDVSERELNDADTVAIAPANLPGDTMDDTLQLATLTPISQQRSNSEQNVNSSHDASMDVTADLSVMDLEESTIAMDDEAFALAQQTYKSKQRD